MEHDHDHEHEEEHESEHEDEHEGEHEHEDEHEGEHEDEHEDEHEEEHENEHEAEHEGEHEDEHEHEHDEEHHHETDEHVWLSLRNAKALCGTILDALCIIDSAYSEMYKHNADSYIAKLTELDTQYQEAVNAASVKTLLFGDRFPFRYMVDDYGLDYYAAFSGCSAETEASFIIVLAINLVGSLLISALVIFPALSAMRIFKSFRSVTICSAVLSVFCALFGILISILAGTPVDSTIVAVDIGAFAITSIIGKVFGR